MASEKLLYIGLDQNDERQNRELAENLANSDTEGDFGFKLNLDHALIWGKNYIQDIVAIDRPVFVDLKMNNGPRTMTNIVRWLGGLGVTHTNIWAHAEENLTRTMDQLETITDKPKILGVTFYTRWTEQYAKTHYNMTLEDLIKHWAHTAVDSGVDGIILPATHLHSVNDLNTTKLTPGIRMIGEQTRSHQQQVANPYEAIKNGADIIVVGSPIYGATDPTETVQLYLDDVKRAEDDSMSEF